MKDKLVTGLRRKATYDSLVHYLDGGQETIKYPDRLAMQIQNSHQMSNLINDEGESWLGQNKEQSRNFTRQQVKEILIKKNLQPGQTFQREKVAHRMSVQQAKIEDMTTPKPRQPKATPRHEIGLTHTPTQHPDKYVKVHDMVDKGLDEKMEEQHHDIEKQYAFETAKEEEKKNDIAQRFKMDLGDELPPYRKAFPKQKSKFDKSYSSTDNPEIDEPKVKRGRPPKDHVMSTVETPQEPKRRGRPPKVVSVEMESQSTDTKRKTDQPPTKGKKTKLTKEEILLRLQQAEEEKPKAKASPKAAPKPEPKPEPEPPEPEPPKPKAKAKAKAKPKPDGVPPVIKADFFNKERPLLPPAVVNLTGITESFKVAKNRGQISIVHYAEYNNVFNEYKRSAGNKEKKAILLEERRVLYAKYIYKK